VRALPDDRLKGVEMRQRLDDGFDARTDEHRPNRAADGRDGGRGGRDDDAGAVPRPVPTTPVAVRVREWVGWFGPTRLVTSAVAVVVVCAGAWFLVRTPPPPSEADLPVARPPSGGPSGPEATLPVATAVGDPLGTPAPGPVIVHVAGAVLLPGVYQLGPGSRVDDAVRSAGGPTDGAELGRINLAAPLVDGDQIYVPEVGEVAPQPAPVPASAGPDLAPSGPVDVNRAPARELETLPGVGPATAAAIVAERERNGPFASFEDLERVPGIGPAKLAGLVGLVIT
jgi:competence protein ComEA